MPSLSVLTSERLGGQRGREFLSDVFAQDMSKCNYRPCNSAPAIEFMKALAASADSKRRQSKRTFDEFDRDDTTAADTEMRRSNSQSFSGESGKSTTGALPAEHVLKSYLYPLPGNEDWMVRWSKTYSKNLLHKRKTEEVDVDSARSTFALILWHFLRQQTREDGVRCVTYRSKHAHVRTIVCPNAPNCSDLSE